MVEDLDEPDSGLPGAVKDTHTPGTTAQQQLQVSVLFTVELEELCIVSQLAGLQSEAELNNVTASISTKHLLPAPGKQ